MSKLTPFNKVLVANRGEIALRVMRSAKSLGFRTVAVYSSADADAAHVRAAYQAVHIGEPLPAQSYLRIASIIDAARATGADAVHPGYGFLAENEEFAAACHDAGLVFIGPSSQAIHAMGDKAGAKRLMEHAGVPCIPGYQGDNQTEAWLAEEADRLGYPLMIKATAGGGGRGMRLVRSAPEFLDLLRSAQSEARNAFGDATVILERAIIEPRHIEIQIFADRYGNAIHLGERDCSVQRRHQKLIEEAPSPAVNAELRERMGAAAVAAAKAIGYEGAGTLEFLLDQQGRFFFMEMNTRLQVEHPVTEAITGLDLVEWQLRIASGEPLPLAQHEVRFQGHAIEVRLCAEDTRKGFMPQSGVMRRWHAPQGVRVEHALASGTVIPPYYDSMIAKVVAHGKSRTEATRQLRHALSDEMIALGVTTNQEFLARCLAHPAFESGRATTAFIGQHETDLLALNPFAQARAAAVATWLLLETAVGRPGGEPGRLAHAHPISLRFELAGKHYEARARQIGRRDYDILLDGKSHTLRLIEVHGHIARFILDGVMESSAFDRDGSSLWLKLDGVSYEVEDRTRAATGKASDVGGDGCIRASMNGRVVAVNAAVGEMVKAGQPLIVIEAMKMEHIHAALVDGSVTAIYVSVGDQVSANRMVAEIALVQRPEKSIAGGLGDR